MSKKNELSVPTIKEIEKIINLKRVEISQILRNMYVGKGKGKTYREIAAETGLNYTRLVDYLNNPHLMSLRTVKEICEKLNKNKNMGL